jgi:1,4-dihydroxy-2-naphthoate octaprenyltransferase
MQHSPRAKATVIPAIFGRDRPRQPLKWLRTLSSPARQEPVIESAPIPSPTPDAIRPGSLRAWMIAMRPRSLLVAVSPVLVAIALAFERAGSIDMPTSSLVLGCAVLVQIITNLQNDVGYTVRGGERAGNRRGLPRATAQGWLTVGAVRIGIVVLSVLAAALGAALYVTRGWPVLAIGGASLAAALAYMAGPRPIAFTPFGELTVFVFFGLVAVTGTDWVLTGQIGSATWLAAIAIGCLAAAALAVNNHRDMAHDRSVGRATFAALAGAQASLRFYTVLLVIPFLLLPAIALAAGDLWFLAPAALVPASVGVRRAFANAAPGLAFNAVLFRTFGLEMQYSALMAAGAIVGRLLR